MTWGIILFILLIAFALRSYAITTVPPGLTHDEIAQLDIATKIQNGDWRLLYPESYGAEPAYHVLLAASQWIWRANPLARRLPAIFAGMLGLACTYILAVRMFGKTVGLVTLGTASITWWSIVLARMVLREILVVPLYALALYGFWRGFQKAGHSNAPRALVPFVLGGAALGAAQYVYTVPRGLFIVFILFELYLLIFHRRLFHRTWRGSLVLVLTAEVIASPLLITAALYPEIDRLPLDAYIQPSEQVELVERLTTSIPWMLGQFAFRGDPWWNFNIPDRPVFEPIGATLFSLGLLMALWQFRHPAHALALITWAVSLLPNILLDPNFPFTRMSNGQVIVFTCVGLGIQTANTGLCRITPRQAQLPLAVVSLIGLFLLNLIGTARDMFVVWPSLPNTRSTYHAELGDFSRYLDTQDQPLPISQCTLWITYPFNPRYHWSVAQDALPHFTQRRDLDVRWHDCRYSIVIPSSGQFLYSHTDLEPLSDFMNHALMPWLKSSQPISGLNGVMPVNVRTKLEQKISQWDQLTIAWPPETIGASPPRLPVDLGHMVELIGYEIAPMMLKPGTSVRVTTYWRVIGTLPEDLLIFVHLYQTPTQIMAQQDQLDISTLHVRRGDIFGQVHEFITAPTDTPPGSYWLGVGLYRQSTKERLPVLLSGDRVADRIFLTQIQIAP